MGFPHMCAPLRRALQDGPPAGGFKPVHVKRSLPERGPSGPIILAGVVGVCAWGWYLMGKSNLQVEDDIRESSMLSVNRKLEEAVMSDVKGYKAGFENVYSGKRYVSPIVKVL